MSDRMTRSISGAYGSTFISDTSVHNGSWSAIFMVEATVFNVLTDATRDGNAIAAESFPVGSTIYGNFTSIDLTSGAVIAYKVAPITAL